MFISIFRPVIVFSAFGICAVSCAIDDKPEADETENLQQRIRIAIDKSIPLLEKAASGSADERTCFTCHNQAMPIITLSAARNRGFKIDRDNLQRQIKHTVDHLERGRNGYLEFKGQGGQALTAGFALWGLADADHEPDEITAAVTGYLLEYQKKDIHWKHRGNRPPTSGSDFTATYVALRGIGEFKTESQTEKAGARSEAVLKWLLDTQPAETEDHVFRLKSLVYLEADKSVVQSAVSEILKLQQEDGGWAQKADMSSDAYATGSVVATLLSDGLLPNDHPAIKKGIDYLLKTQAEDGSWHVKTRAKGFQEYYETGFPYEQDQFISMSASCWATWALILSAAKTESPGDTESPRQEASFDIADPS